MKCDPGTRERLSGPGQRERDVARGKGGQLGVDSREVRGNSETDEL